MSREVTQFLEMVKEQFVKVERENRKKVIRRKMYCEVCGCETDHELQMSGEWEVLKCGMPGCGGGHWYRTG